ncbi:MAG: MBL fold metallo-hydrolase [Rubrivivax sp.]|nr:MBL fold metallo-hydrolase [Rubrivivax sp.]
MSGGYIPAADARTAASLLLLRDGDAGLEVLMLRRAERGDDPRSGAMVFPGGVLDPRDVHAHADCIGHDDRHWSGRLGVAERGLDYLVAALRECFEEVGLLLACAPDGSALDLAPRLGALHPWRERLNRGEVGMADFCRETGLRLDLRGLAYYSHWLTPPGSPKRFDTRFFCALAPHGQVAQADLGEAMELLWLTPAAALDPARDLKLLPVTRRTLADLARHTRAADAWQAAAVPREIRLVMPRRAVGRQGPRVVLPDEHSYAEIGRLDPHGHGRASADLVPGAPVSLSERVIRVTAPNPGPMTGPGTNSYIVHEGGRGCTVIDPGPPIDEHLRALIAAAPGPIERILVTHTHKDHSPAAALLHAATGAPVHGRRADHPMWQDDTFAPAVLLAGGERLAIGPATTLTVVHTPGHASNHLCYLLEEERTLFTGDHVMQGSTVVINPPDGDMSAYLRALEGLLRLEIDWFAPGHGWLVAQPHDVVRALVAHRLGREAKVADALRRLGPATVEALVPDVYAEVPKALHPMAQRSLLAHLLKLRDDGAAALDADSRWSAPAAG